MESEGRRPRPPGDSGERLRAWLRTQIDLGEPEVFIEGLRRTELLARVRAAASAHRGGGPVPGVVSASIVEPPMADLGRLAREATAAEIEHLPDLDSLRSLALACTRCPLHETRKNVVFAEGSADARVMCVGEAPGAREDERGLPFVGRAGKLLDVLLLAVGFRREEVYICNVLKCRPPGNRNPQAEEIERCSPFLRRQVALVEPEVIVAFGTFAAQTLLGSRESLGRLRGRIHRFEARPLVATYHPAALLRNPAWRRPTWEDLQRARRIAEPEAAEAAAAGGEAGDGRAHGGETRPEARGSTAHGEARHG